MKVSQILSLGVAGYVAFADNVQIENDIAGIVNEEVEFQDFPVKVSNIEKTTETTDKANRLMDVNEQQQREQQQKEQLEKGFEKILETIKISQEIHQKIAEGKSSEITKEQLDVIGMTEEELKEAVELREIDQKIEEGNIDEISDEQLKKIGYTRDELKEAVEFREINKNIEERKIDQISDEQLKKIGISREDLTKQVKEEEEAQKEWEEFLNKLKIEEEIDQKIAEGKIDEITDEQLEKIEKTRDELIKEAKEREEFQKKTEELQNKLNVVTEIAPKIAEGKIEEISDEQLEKIGITKEQITQGLKIASEFQEGNVDPLKKFLADNIEITDEQLGGKSKEDFVGQIFEKFNNIDISSMFEDMFTPETDIVEEMSMPKIYELTEEEEKELQEQMNKYMEDASKFLEKFENTEDKKELTKEEKEEETKMYLKELEEFFKSLEVEENKVETIEENTGEFKDCESGNCEQKKIQVQEKREMPRA